MADSAVVVGLQGKRRFANLGRGVFTQSPLCQLILFQDNVVLDENSLFLDVTECDFSGYGRQNLTAGVSFLNPDTRWEFDLVPVAFAFSPGAPTNDVYGWMIVWPYLPGPADGFICGKNYDPPRPMAFLGDGVVIAPRFILDQVAAF